MLKGEDVVVLLKLTVDPGGWTVRSLAEGTGIPRSVIHRALGRLTEARLLNARQESVNRGNAEEFLIHAVKYIFPPVLGGETRGIPTAWATMPLVAELAPSSDLPPVWPDPEGRLRGLALTPLHQSVATIVRHDRALAERLALVDAIRLGDARIRGLAVKALQRCLSGAGQSL